MLPPSRDDHENAGQAMAKRKTGKEIVDALIRQIQRAREDTNKLDYGSPMGNKPSTAMHTLITMRHLATVLNTVIGDLSPERPAARRRQASPDEPTPPGG